MHQRANALLNLCHEHIFIGVAQITTVQELFEGQGNRLFRYSSLLFESVLPEKQYHAEDTPVLELLHVLSLAFDESFNQGDNSLAITAARVLSEIVSKLTLLPEKFRIVESLGIGGKESHGPIKHTYCSGSSKNDSGRRRRIVYLGALLNIWKLIKQKVAVDGTSQSYEGFVYGAMLCAPSKVTEIEFNSLFDEQFNPLPSTQESIKKHTLLAHDDPIENC